MDTFEKSLYLLFPSFIRVSPDKNTFKGTFDLGEERGIKLVTFHVPNYPNARNICYEGDLNLTEKDTSLLKLASESNNFLDYLKLFETTLTRITPKKLLDRFSFEMFYNDMMTVRKKYNPRMEFDCDNLVLTMVNYSNVIQNTITVQVNFEKKGFYSMEVLKCDLPKNKDQNLFKKCSNSVLNLYEKFLRLVETLEIFYDTINKIDMICWVLDPINPEPSQNFRRIVIDTNVSVELVFDPYNMSKAPKFKFFGPTKLTEPFILKLSENLEEWDSDYDTYQNILKLLDLPFFPIKPEETCTERNENLLYDKTECCVCFSYNLNDKTPDVICSNSSCSVHFHSSCLYEWLSSLPSAQVIFEQIHGNCPNCEEAIFCAVPKKEIY